MMENDVFDTVFQKIFCSELKYKTLLKGSCAYSHGFKTLNDFKNALHSLSLHLIRCCNLICIYGEIAVFVNGFHKVAADLALTVFE